MDTLEVWLLQQCNDDNAPGALAHSSVLDRATDRSFLDIAGARSALAVHGQGVAASLTSWFTLECRPREQSQCGHQGSKARGGPLGQRLQAEGAPLAYPASLTTGRSHRLMTVRIRALPVLESSHLSWLSITPVC